MDGQMNLKKWSEPLGVMLPEKSDTGHESEWLNMNSQINSKKWPEPLGVLHPTHVRIALGNEINNCNIGITA